MKKALLGIAAAVVLVWASYTFLLPAAEMVRATPTPRATATPALYRVTYRVTGNTSKAGLTYTNAQGGSEQVKVDQERILGLDQWEKTFTAKAGHFAYISAQNLASEGDIRVRILVNGNVWKESSSSGGHVIATTSGTIGQ